MGTVIDITQYELVSSLANEETDAKIKLRASSHANLIRHLKNIPYKAVKGSKINSSKFHFPITEMKMNVLPQKNMDSTLESQKPINVKEEKFENIRKHSNILISMAIDEQQSEQEKIVSVQAPIVEEAVNVQQEAINNNSLNEVNTDISEYIAKLNNEAQLVKNVKEEAILAQQEANASDENVNKLSIEVSELEKQEVAIEKQNNELDRELITAYENQTRTLVLARKEYEDLIRDANDRKQANDNKIVLFQSRIDDLRNHITDVNESIARKQEILAALQQTEFPDVNSLVQFPNENETIQFMSDSEEKIKSKVA